MNEELLPPHAEGGPPPAGSVPTWAQTGDGTEGLRAQLNKVDELGTELYGLYPHLCAWGKRKRLTHHDAEQAAMEAIRRVLTAMNNGTKPISLKLYTFKTLFRVIGDYKNPGKESNHIALDDVPLPIAPESVPVDLPDDSELHGFLSKVLTTRQKEIFLLRVAKEMTHKEIAKELGISAATVRVHFFQAQLRLSVYKGQRPEEFLP